MSTAPNNSRDARIALTGPATDSDFQRWIDEAEAEADERDDIETSRYGWGPVVLIVALACFVAAMVVKACA